MDKNEIEFDIEKLINTANSLGIKAKINSDNPGIHFVSKDGNVRSVSYEQTFKLLDDYFGFSKDIK